MLPTARFNITDVTEVDCPRKSILQIMMVLKSIPKDFQESAPIIAGSVLHNILQNGLITNFELIKYYYLREGLKLALAIEKSFNKEYEKWYKLINQDKNEFPWAHNTKFKNTILKKVKESIPIFSKMSTSLFRNFKGDLITTIIGREFELDYEIYKNFFIKGKVDLFAWQENDSLRIIEIKTGRPNESHSNQVLLYSEIISKDFSDKTIIPEIWNPTNNLKADIDYPEFKNKNENLEKTKNLLIQALNMENEESLPPMIDNDFVCRNFCRICLDKMSEIFPDSNEKDDFW